VADFFGGGGDGGKVVPACCIDGSVDVAARGALGGDLTWSGGGRWLGKSKLTKMLLEAAGALQRSRKGAGAGVSAG
jgi:hypothetical protein